MHILRNIYRSTTAPRGLWLDLHRKLAALGGKPALVETEHGFPKPIGLMGGHVDDFHRVGCRYSTEWQEIKRQIDAAYKWGTSKVDEHRHAGTDLKVSRDADGNQVIIVNQQYIDMIEDVQISSDRIRDETAKLSTTELASYRTALGALQWLVVQTQSLLQSSVDGADPASIHGNGIGDSAVIGEVRLKSTVLIFFKLK